MRTIFLAALLSAQTAMAGGIAVVDFNKAGPLVKRATASKPSCVNCKQNARLDQRNGKQIMECADYEKQARF